MRTQEQIQESLNELKFVCASRECAKKDIISRSSRPSSAGLRERTEVHGRGSSLDEMLDNFRI